MKIIELRVQEIDPLFNDKPNGHWYARAHIVVAFNWTDNNDGTILLSAECRTAREVEEYADLMIKELEQIKRKAKQMD
jgi:hypothetical protein